MPIKCPVAPLEFAFLADWHLRERGIRNRTELVYATPVKPNVFALGDATDLPTSKAGSVTHFEAEVLTENIARYLAGDELDTGYDGHANCFIETGFHKALLIDFNYETEPLPGHFPTAFGLPLLRESRLNHLGKLAFQWVYWHALLPGREIPGIGPAMPTAGKKRTSTPVHT
jgi:sulfide:quinone oxidoreductase